MASSESITGEASSDVSLAGQLAWRASVLGAALFLAVSMLLAVQGFSRVDQQPLGNTAALAIAAAALAMAALVRWPLLCCLPRRTMSAARAIVLIAPSMALLLALVFLSALTSLPILVLTGGLFALTEAWLMYAALAGKTSAPIARLEPTPSETTPSEPTPSEPTPLETTPLETDVGEEYTSPPDDELAAPPAGWQQLTRTRNDAGGECMTGRITLEFAIGQRSQFTHVAFCPAWPKTPAIEAECVDGWPAEIRIEEAAPHGVRFEIRVSPPPTEPCETVFVFTAADDDA